MMDQEPRKKMTAAGKFFAGLFALGLTVALVMLLIMLTLNYTVFNANFMQNILVDQKVYEQIPDLVFEALEENISQQDQSETANAFLSSLNEEQMNQLILLVLPANYIQDQTENIIDSLYSFLNLETTSLNLVIDLTPIKANLYSSSGQEAFMALFDSFPECTEEQLKAVMQGGENSAEAAICKPPEEYMEIAESALFTKLSEFADTLPDSMVIVDQSQAGDIEKLTSSIPFQLYKAIREFSRLIPLVALVLALIIILLTLRSLRTMLVSLGSPLFLSGIAAGAGIFLVLYLGKIYLSSAQNSLGQFSVIFTAVFSAVMQRIGLMGLIFCGLAAGLGFVMWLVSRFIHE